MTELGWTDYPVPSRGVLYDGKIPGGKVKLREMTSKQVNLLQQQGGGIVGKLDAIVDTCCKLPEGSKDFDKRDLLLTDRFAILLALRTKSFGPKYDFRWRCRDCGAWSMAHVDIAEELEEKIGTAKGTKEPVEVELEKAGCTVTARFLRGHDEEQIAKNAKRLQMQSNDDEDKSYLFRLAMQLVKKDGEDFGNILARQRFIEGLAASDTYHLEDTVSAAEPGVDTRVYLECKKCESTNEMRLPFTADFFRPRKRD